MNTPYEQVMQKYLLLSLKRFCLPYDIQGVKDLGSWKKNTDYKATFIKEMLLKHKQSVVFLDADAEILQYPFLFDMIETYKGLWDFGYHNLDWYLQWRGHEGNKFCALSGTLYLNYNKKVLNFLDTWIDYNKKSIDWEQRNMEAILKSGKNNLSIYSLPYEYCSIIKQDGKLPPHVNEDKVVILHNQVSRKYKK
jgi:hypothetical protein